VEQRLVVLLLGVGVRDVPLGRVRDDDAPAVRVERTHVRGKQHAERSRAAGRIVPGVDEDSLGVFRPEIAPLWSDCQARDAVAERYLARLPAERRFERGLRLRRSVDRRRPGERIRGGAERYGASQRHTVHERPLAASLPSRNPAGSPARRRPGPRSHEACVGDPQPCVSIEPAFRAPPPQGSPQGSRGKGRCEGSFVYRVSLGSAVSALRRRECVRRASVCRRSAEAGGRVRSDAPLEDGRVSLGDGVARLAVTPQWRYLGPEDAERSSSTPGNNPPGRAERSACCFPRTWVRSTRTAGASSSRTRPRGHVSDADAEEQDYEALLHDMQAAVREQNEKRERDGYPPVELVGWAARPLLRPGGAQAALGARSCASARTRSTR